MERRKEKGVASSFFFFNFIRYLDYLDKSQVYFISKQYISLLNISNHKSFSWIPE